MAETKLQVMGSAQGGGGGHDEGSAVGSDIGNGFIYRMLHRRLWVEALAAATHLDLMPVEEPQARGPKDHDWIYDAVLNQLRNAIVPRINDPFAATRAKGIARLVKYLGQIDKYGWYYEACELEDLRNALGHAVSSVEQGRVEATEAVESGALTDDDYLRLLWRRIVRDTELARPAMGVLADRHWPDLLHNPEPTA